MEEYGSIDFTVQDVVDRSKMSIRTFYNFFASKDDLLVAVHETILATEVVPRMRAKCEAEPDPIKRVEVYIKGIYDLTSNPGPVSRALTTYSNRLTETRPQDLERAFKPQIDLVVELIEGAKATGRLHTPLSAETAARLLHHAVLATIHARILGAEQEHEVSAADLWTSARRASACEGTEQQRTGPRSRYGADVTSLALNQSSRSVRMTFITLREECRPSRSRAPCSERVVRRSSGLTRQHRGQTLPRVRWPPPPVAPDGRRARRRP